MKMQCFSSIFKIVEFSIWSLRKICAALHSRAMFLCFHPSRKSSAFVCPAVLVQCTRLSVFILLVCLQLLFFSVEIQLKWQRPYSSDRICERQCFRCANHQHILLFFRYSSHIFYFQISSSVQCILLHSKQLMDIFCLSWI